MDERPKALTSAGRRFPRTAATKKICREHVNGKKSPPFPLYIGVENEW